MTNDEGRKPEGAPERSPKAGEGAPSGVDGNGPRIVFTFAGDPVQEGLVASLNRPGGNVPGISWFNALLGGKALGLLQEFVPNAAIIALMVNPKTPEFARMLSDAQHAARTLGRQLLVLEASDPSEIDTAFATLRQRRAGALLVSAASFLTARRQQIVALAARDAIPAMYPNRDFVVDGGLMSYGNDVTDAYRRAGVYAFSRAKSPPICRSIRPPGLNWSSVRRQPRRSGSSSAGNTRHRRRGDRVNQHTLCTSFVALHESVPGTSLQMPTL